MHWIEFVLPALGGVLEVSIIAFLIRRGIQSEFHAYTIYIVFALAQVIAGELTILHPAEYLYVFWITSPVEVGLTLLAVLESFWRVFRSFRLLSWFRFVLPVAIGTAMTYSAVQGYRFPPIETTPAGAAMINAAMTSHYVILAVALLFFLLAGFFHIPARIHEHRFVLGFGVASLAAVLGASVRAVFGSRFEFVSMQAQPIGYIVALLIWLFAVVHPLPNGGAVVQPVENLESLKFQLRNLRSFVRKSTR